MLGTRTRLNLELGDIESANFFDWPPIALFNSHPDPVLGVGVEAFNESEAIIIGDPLEDFFSLDFHANSILNLILDILKREMNEAKMYI